MQISHLLEKGKLKSLLPGLLIGALSLSIIGTTPIAFATTSDYTVSGGNPGSLPTVGAASVSLPTVTLTNGDGDTEFGANEVIEIAINNTNYGPVQFDQSVAFGGLTIAGTCG